MGNCCDLLNIVFQKKSHPTLVFEYRMVLLYYSVARQFSISVPSTVDSITHTGTYNLQLLVCTVELVVLGTVCTNE
jgi:hypothetical protein